MEIQAASKNTLGAKRILPRLSGMLNEPAARSRQEKRKQQNRHQRCRLQVDGAADPAFGNVSLEML
jgi:hypothetical protein